ncbi:MAG: hypothetical protein EBU40_11885 [Proteobacteria bacterium]|nr:hypothetical protein [Pseudomonadota bacterium]
MIAEVAAPASLNVSKSARTVRTVSARGINRTHTAVTKASVPSLPVRIPGKSYPGASGELAMVPQDTMVPSMRTASMPRTWLVVTP